MSEKSRAEKGKRAEVAQLVKCLPCKHEDLSVSSRIYKKSDRRGGEERQVWWGRTESGEMGLPVLVSVDQGSDLVRYPISKNKVDSTWGRMTLKVIVWLYMDVHTH